MNFAYYGIMNYFDQILTAKLGTTIVIQWYDLSYWVVRS